MSTSEYITKLGLTSNAEALHMFDMLQKAVYKLSDVKIHLRDSRGGETAGECTTILHNAAMLSQHNSYMEKLLSGAFSDVTEETEGPIKWKVVNFTEACNVHLMVLLFSGLTMPTDKLEMNTDEETIKNVHLLSYNHICELLQFIVLCEKLLVEHFHLKGMKETLGDVVRRYNRWWVRYHKADADHLQKSTPHNVYSDTQLPDIKPPNGITHEDATLWKNVLGSEHATFFVLTHTTDFHVAQEAYLDFKKMTIPLASYTEALAHPWIQDRIFRTNYLNIANPEMSFPAEIEKKDKELQTKETELQEARAEVEQLRNKVANMVEKVMSLKRTYDQAFGEEEFQPRNVRCAISCERLSIVDAKQQ